MQCKKICIHSVHCSQPTAKETTKSGGGTILSCSCCGFLRFLIQGVRVGDLSGIGMGMWGMVCFFWGAADLLAIPKHLCGCDLWGFMWFDGVSSRVLCGIVALY